MKQLLCLFLSCLMALPLGAVPMPAGSSVPDSSLVRYIHAGMPAAAITNLLATSTGISHVQVLPGSYVFDGWTTPVRITNIHFWPGSTFYIGGTAVPLITDTNGVMHATITGAGRFWYTNQNNRLYYITNRNSRVFFEFYSSDGGGIRTDGGTNDIISYGHIQLTNASTTAVFLADTYGTRTTFKSERLVSNPPGSLTDGVLALQGSGDPEAIVVDAGYVGMWRGVTPSSVRCPFTATGGFICRNTTFDCDSVNATNGLGYVVAAVGRSTFENCTFLSTNVGVDALWVGEDVGGALPAEIVLKGCTFRHNGTQFPPIEVLSTPSRASWMTWRDCVFVTSDADDGAISHDTPLRLEGTTYVNHVHPTVKFENNYLLSAPTFTNSYTSPGGTNVIVNCAGMPLQFLQVTNAMLLTLTNTDYFSGNRGTLLMKNDKATNMNVDYARRGLNFFATGASNTVAAGRTLRLDWEIIGTNCYLRTSTQ